MQEFSVFAQLRKVDEDQRLVIGQLAAEVPDKSGEIMDYNSSKPFFRDWSSSIFKATGGKSAGNVRSMHNKIAAGKLEKIEFDDAARAINGVARIIDSEEWEKIRTGVYTGFSIGGSYVKRWQDPENPDLVRYTARPIEVSIVDCPAIPTAVFEVVKAGVAEVRKFKSAELPPHRQFAVDQAMAKFDAARTSYEKALAKAEINRVADVLREDIASANALAEIRKAFARPRKIGGFQ
ncbi:hypothetical protein [Rhodoblastus acidophilus]|uniref:hypothetical protein n=1 Tax=Rhodoblastus acidophilus TaxID=1074 RepID=UPI00222457A6|nr:hypothetical protein [Rhodoblastus acidophilus]